MSGKKISVITGAAKGIGKSIAYTLANNGYYAVLVDCDQISLDGTVNDMRRKDLDVDFFCANIVKNQDVNELVNYLVEKYGRIDILINNAGISPKDSANKKLPTIEIDDAQWDLVMEVNLKSIFLLSKAIVPHMIANRYGKIVNIASVMGKTGCSGTGNAGFPISTSGAHYCVSKAGVICLTQCLARELAVYNINVNAVAPGAVDGGMGKFDNEFTEKLIKQIPMGKLAQRQDIANAVEFLISEKADYITGEIIDVNGGWLMD